MTANFSGNNNCAALKEYIRPIMADRKSGIINEMQEKLFLKQGKGWFRIVSGSMRPLLNIEDRILARRVEPTEIKRRDIILFSNSSVFVTHRAIDILNQNGKNMILQRGDAGGGASLIDAETVMGKVVALEKNGKILCLERGIGKFFDALFGLKNVLFYQLNLKNTVRQWLRDKPGYGYLRTLYRLSIRPFAHFNRVIVRILLE